MIKIFVDSTSDISQPVADRYDISIIPLFINMDGQYYRDGIDIERSKIFKWSDETGETPKTAAPAIDDVVNAFKPYVEAGDEIFYFSISEDMSTTANVARLAATELEYEDKIHVVDSQSLSTGIALQAIKAAEMINDGYPSSVIYNRILDLRSKVRASFVVDTLTYLSRGGRCSAATALIGNALKLKPKIEVIEGKMDATTKYRGSSARVIDHYVQDMKADILKAERSRVFITHTVTEGDSVQRVKEFLEGLNYFDEIIVTEAGGVISSHCGPGTLGVLYIEG